MKGIFLVRPRWWGLLLLLAIPPFPAWTAPNEIVVCYPGGPVDEAEANAAMSAMLRVAERVGGWPTNNFTSRFTSKLDECRRLMNNEHPAFAITSLGLYLELRNAQHLVPLSQPRIQGGTSERYYLVSRQQNHASLDGLRGKTVSGSVFEEPEFTRKIVFAGKLDPATFFDLKPTRQAVRALRSLDKGELEAVLLNGQQYAALGSLPLKSSLETIFTSDDIPLMGMVANSQTSTAGDRDRFAKALQAMCADRDGKKLCELFGVEAFVPANERTFEPMVRLWQQDRN